jgi:hypothetical protein
MTSAFIATLIFAISPLALLQFFASYCHSLITKSRGYDLSDHTREVSRLTARTFRGDQFKRLLRLIALCPEPGGDCYQLRAVSTYFGMLSLTRALFHWAFPVVGKWIESERDGCTSVAAMVLDQRIAYSRTLIARQAIPFA